MGAYKQGLTDERAKAGLEANIEGGEADGTIIILQEGYLEKECLHHH